MRWYYMLSHVQFIITYIHEYLRVQRQGFADLSIKNIILYGHLHKKKVLKQPIVTKHC